MEFALCMVYGCVMRIAYTRVHKSEDISAAGGFTPNQTHYTTPCGLNARITQTRDAIYAIF